MQILTTGNYYGIKNIERRVNKIVLSEYDYVVDSTQWHYHENPYLMYVLDGQLHDINHKSNTRCIPGALLFHNWEDPHYNKKVTQKARGFHCELDRNWLASINCKIAIPEGSKALEHPDYHMIMHKIMYEFHNDDHFSKPAIELLILQLCELLRDKEHQSYKQFPSWVPHLVELLNDESHPYSLSNLANQIGVHPVHLSRAMPKYLSHNLGEYLRRNALKKATIKMRDLDLSLSDIAYDCGFSDQSHLSRTFKRYFSTTTSDYRKVVHINRC